MSTFNIKVTEYGIERGRKIQPEHYDWDYCVENKIPYIIVHPKIKYSVVEYNLMPIDNGVTFENERILADFWLEFYDNYVIEANAFFEELFL